MKINNLKRRIINIEKSSRCRANEKKGESFGVD